MRRVVAIAAALDSRRASRQSPPRYVASDGQRYWLKGDPTAAGEFTLVAELIAGQIGATLRVSPPVAVVEVPEFAIEHGHEALVGLCFGSQDQTGMLNIRELADLGFRIPVELINVEQAARVRVFQSWIGHGDWQCLLSAEGGDLMLSFDHEVWAMGRPANEMQLISFDSRLDGLVWTKAARDSAIQSIADLDDELVRQMCADLPDDHRFWAPADLLADVASKLIERKRNIWRLADEWQAQ